MGEVYPYHVKLSAQGFYFVPIYGNTMAFSVLLKDSVNNTPMNGTNDYSTNIQNYPDLHEDRIMLSLITKIYER